MKSKKLVSRKNSASPPQRIQRTSRRKIVHHLPERQPALKFKAWSGRFSKATNSLMESFTSSLHIDQLLFEYDIQGSIAHCQTLEKAKVLSHAEAKKLIRGLHQVQSELRKDNFSFIESDEDIHMAIERRLTELIGPLGGKLHTGRSRNDQAVSYTHLTLPTILLV